jgi:hypothetical protein
MSTPRCRICGALFASHDFVNEGGFRGVTRNINGCDVFHYYEALPVMSNPITRRIVTDGRVFRIQLCYKLVSIDPLQEPMWTFYPGEYQTQQAAQVVVDKWNDQDRREAEAKWVPVE